MRCWIVYSVAILTLSMGCGSKEDQKDRNSTKEVEQLRDELNTSGIESEKNKKEALEIAAAKASLEAQLAILEAEKIAAGIALNDAMIAKSEAEKSSKESDMQRSLAIEDAKKAESARAEAIRKMDDAEKAKKAAETMAVKAQEKVSLIEKEIRKATNISDFSLAAENSLEVLKSLLLQNPSATLITNLKIRLGLDGSADNNQIIEKITEALADQKKVIQVFLGNSAPETLFAMDTDDVASTYKLNSDEECMMIFSINHQVNIVPIPLRNKLPSLREYTVLPIRAPYQKVVACKKNNQYQVQLEKGWVYKLISLNDENKQVLITGREESNCDSFAKEIKDKDLFGATYQTFSTFRGEIDGIESVDFGRVISGANRFHMGSAVYGIGAANCIDVIGHGASSELATLACKVALGKEKDDSSVKLGCFIEQENDGLRLIFNEKG